MRRLRERLVPLLGRFPDPYPLRMRVESEEQLDGYRRQRVSYAVEPRERVSAYLLLPDGIGASCPSVLAIHQHAGQYYLGKSEPAGLSADTMYHYGLELCRRGYVVLCPDHLCFEERRPPEYRRMEHRGIQDGNYERFEFTRRLLHGSTLQTKYLSDLQRALDLLQGLPMVDPDRIGIIGHSLGGQEVMWLAWYDPRVRVAVCSCGIGTLRTILRDYVNHNFAAYVPGLLDVCDIDEFVADVAPTPFLMTAGDADGIFPIDGVRDIGATAATAYGAAGVQDAFELIVFPGGHGFPAHVRERSYAFIDRYLKG